MCNIDCQHANLSDLAVADCCGDWVSSITVEDKRQYMSCRNTGENDQWVENTGSRTTDPRSEKA